VHEYTHAESSACACPDTCWAKGDSERRTHALLPSTNLELPCPTAHTFAIALECTLLTPCVQCQETHKESAAQR